MKIAICEDNGNERNLLTEYIEASLQARGVKAELFAYEDGESLLADTKKHFFSILFLDIYLPGKNGMEVALKLRRSGSNAAIVFTTVTDDFLAQSYEVWAVHYLVKPLAAETVDESVGRALVVLQGEAPTLEVLVSRHNEYIPHSDIYYIEGSNRQCAIHTRTGTYTPYASVKELMDKLNDSRFIHCHRSYIVNLEHVLGIQQERVAVRGDVMIPIRRGEVAAVRRAYEDFRFEQVRRRE